MNFHRIVAVYIDNEDGQPNPDYKITLLLPLSSTNDLIDGQWSGNLFEKNFNYPFLLNVSGLQVKVDYGWEVEGALINISKEKIKVGGYFSVTSLPESKEDCSVYQITSIHKY